MTNTVPKPWIPSYPNAIQNLLSPPYPSWTISPHIKLPNKFTSSPLAPTKSTLAIRRALLIALLFFDGGTIVKVEKVGHEFDRSHIRGRNVKEAGFVLEGRSARHIIQVS